MAGWLIKVPIKRIGAGNEVITELYAAAIDDASTAVTAVDNAFCKTADEIPETVIELSDATLKSLGVPPGKVKQLQAIIP